MLKVYRYFHSHKPLMYAIMAVSFLVFVFFGLKIKYEEDISSLLPTSSVESQLAFTSIELKDKIYLQVTSADEPLEPEILVERMDEFTDLLLANDSADDKKKEIEAAYQRYLTKQQEKEQAAKDKSDAEGEDAKKILDTNKKKE